MKINNRNIQKIRSEVQEILENNGIERIDASDVSNRLVDNILERENYKEYSGLADDALEITRLPDISPNAFGRIFGGTKGRINNGR